MEAPSTSSFYPHTLILNTILNPGMLAIPAAFSHSGVILSGLIIILFGSLSYKLSCMLLEIHHKSNHIRCSNDQSYGSISISQIIKGEIKPIAANVEEVTNIKIETSYALTIMIGNMLSIIPIIIFNACSLLLMYLCFSTFASVLAFYLPSGLIETCDVYSEDDFFSKCRASYLFYLCIFLIFIYHYISRGIENQVNVHFAACVYRILIIIIASGFCFKLTTSQLNPITGIFKRFKPPTLYNFANIGEILSVCFTCLLVQPQLASIYHLTQRPTSFSTTLKSCFGLSFTLLSLLGVMITLAMEDVQENFSYNFIGFTAGFMWQYRPLYSTFIEILLVMLSPITAFSTALMIGSSLKHNWENYILEKETGKVFLKHSMSYFIMLIPFVFAIFTFKVGTLIKIFGTLASGGFVVLIPVLNLISKKISLCSSQFDNDNTSVWKLIIFALLGFGSCISIVLCS